MLLDIVEVGLLKDLGRHVLVLDPPIGQKGRRIRPLEFHCLIGLVGGAGQGLVAGEQPSELRVREAHEIGRQLRRPALVQRPSPGDQELPLLPHLFGRGNDDFHGPS